MYKIKNKKTGVSWLSKEAVYDPKKFIIEPHEPVPAPKPIESKPVTKQDDSKAESPKSNKQ
jgi:hypothetical protein